MIGFSLENIEIEDFNINYGVELPKEPGVQVSIAPGLGIGDIEENIIACRITHEYLKNNEPIVSSKTVGMFEINKDDWANFIDADKRIITIPREFALNLCSIVVGALRGILLAKLENTEYSKLFLPLMDPYEIFAIDEDVVIKFTKSE